MAERFGARLKYEDELVAEMRQCEEQLELMYLKRKQRKQQKERDEEQRLKEKEKKRARKEEKKRLMKEEIRQLELEEQRLQEAMRQREREYGEKKQLDALKFERMTAEMEKVVAELKEEKSRGDRAREARRIQRNEETAKRVNAREVREMKSKEAVASREQDEKKEKIQMQPDVKDEILMDQKIGINTTSDELHRSQFPTPIPIPHADDVEVPGLCIAESHCGIPPLETCSITSASTPLQVATVNIVPSTVVEELQTACSLEPYCDVTRYEATPTLSDATPALLGSDRPVIPRTMKNPVDFNDSQDQISMPIMCDVKEIPTAFVSESCCDVTSTEAAPSLVHVVPALVVPSHLALNDPLHLTVTDEVDLDGRQDRTLKPVLSEVQADPHLRHLQHGCDGPDESVKCNTDVHEVKLKLADMTLCKAEVPQNRAVEFVQAADLAIPYLSKSHASHTVQIVRLLYCYANTSVSKIFYCVSLCLLYVIYCSIVLRYCTYLSACSV